jgi:hypothetical protein
MPLSRIGRLLVAILLTGILMPACATFPATGASLECEGAQSAEAALRRQVEASPFFALLVERLGLPKHCVRDVVAGAARLTYEFGADGRLEVRSDPRIELSHQRLSLGTLSEKEALAVLQKTEAVAFGRGGCGISWTSAPAHEGAGGSPERQMVYRGDVCNCQARLVYRQARLAQIEFRTAC